MTYGIEKPVAKDFSVRRCGVIINDSTFPADVYKDENIIFDEVNEQWIAFCKNELCFNITDYI